MRAVTQSLTLGTNPGTMAASNFNHKLSYSSTSGVAHGTITPAADTFMRVRELRLDVETGSNNAFTSAIDSLMSYVDGSFGFNVAEVLEQAFSDLAASIEIGNEAKANIGNLRLALRPTDSSAVVDWRLQSPSGSTVTEAVKATLSDLTSGAREEQHGDTSVVDVDIRVELPMRASWLVASSGTEVSGCPATMYLSGAPKLSMSCVPGDVRSGGQHVIRARLW